MAVNEIHPFGSAGRVENGDVMELAEYVADPQRSTGNQLGIARRELVNMVLRQTSHMATGLAQFIANRSDLGVRDDGDVTRIEVGLQAAIDSMLKGLAPTDHEHTPGECGAAPVDHSHDDQYVPLDHDETMWIGAGAMTPQEGFAPEPLAHNAGPYTIDVYEFAADVRQLVGFVFRPPASWDRNTLALKISQYVSSTEIGDVLWRCWVYGLRNGQPVNSPGLSKTLDITVSHDGTSAVLHVSAPAGWTDVAAQDDALLLVLQRRADDARDTLAAPVRLLGVEIQYRVGTEPQPWGA